MDAITQVYITFAIFVFFAFLVALYVIAGKDIRFAFMRRFRSKGADIFMLNPNRHVDRYYKIPDKEGNFKINGKTYITNPDKVGALGDKMKLKVEMSETKRKKRLHKRIQSFNKKKEAAEEKRMNAQNSQKPNEMLIFKLDEHIQNIQEKIDFLKSKLDEKEQQYFMARRSVYFYIENDPVPKDMFEYLSEFDVIQLDNLVARALSKDKQVAKDMEQTLKKMLLYILIIGGIALLAAWFALKGSMGIEDVAKTIGIELTI